MCVGVQNGARPGRILALCTYGNTLMYKLRLVAAAALCCAGAAPLLAGDLGVSINIGEPGFYGRLDIGGFPQPQLIYQRPMVVERAPRGKVREPLYLHVPPGHERHWSKHCAQYNACGQPVYFVRDNWYRDTYVSHYREQNRHEERRGDDHDQGHEQDRDHEHGHDHEQDRDHNHDHDQPQH